MMQEVLRQVPRVMVQDVVRVVQAPAPVIMETMVPAPMMSMPAPIVETIAPMPMTTMAAPMPMTTMAAPMMETYAAPMTTMGTSVMGAPMTTMGGGYGLSPTIL